MKRIVVLGAAESGVGAAVLAKKEGFDVFVSDMSKIKDKEWYKRFVKSGLNECLMVYYDDTVELGESRKKFISKRKRIMNLSFLLKKMI